MTKAQIVLEYEDQLRIVGMILGKKLKHIRIASVALLIQLLFFVFAVADLTFMYVADPDTLQRRDKIVRMISDIETQHV